MMMVAVCFCGIVDQKKRRLALFPAGTIIRDPHHGEFPTRREQELNLRRIWVQVVIHRTTAFSKSRYLVNTRQK